MPFDPVLRELLARVPSCSPADLRAEAMAATAPQLFEAAVRAFGSWPEALAHALVAAVQQPAAAAGGAESPGGTAAGPAGRAPQSAASYSRPLRTPHPEALRPVYGWTAAGYLVRIGGADLPAATGPGALGDARGLLSAAAGGLAGVADLGDGEAILALAADGRVFGFDFRLVPDAADADPARRLGAQSGVQQWTALLERSGLRRAELFVTVTAAGKVKTTPLDAFPQPIAADGVVATLLDEGDAPVGMHAASRLQHLLLVSSDGFGIAFRLLDVRPQGRKATGVRGIELRGTAHVVGSLVMAEVPEVALITAQGFGKRVALDEFRPQARGGQGLVATKLGPGDAIVGIAPCQPAADLLVLTAAGHALRLPAEAFPLMGRAARGNRVIDLLRADDRVTRLSSLLPRAFAEPSELPADAEAGVPGE